MTVSWWSSRADIEGFAGHNIDVAVFYPEDDDYLIDRETTVGTTRSRRRCDTAQSQAIAETSELPVMPLTEC